MSIAKLRQGCILSDGDAFKLGLINQDSKQVVVIISHDCDLASQADENIEFIVGTIQDKLNPQCENSRNPRCLHLRICKQDGNYLCLELKHSNRQQINKQKIKELESLQDIILLAFEKKQTLKQWLAARYARPEFPDAFEKRLRKKVAKKDDVIKLIELITETASCHLLALYFDLGEQRLVELEEGQPYCLSISIVYDTIEGGPEAREHAEQIAEALGELFFQTYGAASSATEIALERCVAIGDDEIRLSDLRKMYQWRLEHLSFQDNPSSSLVTSGQLPV